MQTVSARARWKSGVANAAVATLACVAIVASAHAEQGFGTHEVCCAHRALLLVVHFKRTLLPGLGDIENSKHVGRTWLHAQGTGGETHGNLFLRGSTKQRPCHALCAEVAPPCLVLVGHVARLARPDEGVSQVYRDMYRDMYR